MSHDDLGIGEPHTIVPDSQGESIRRGGIGVLSLAVLIAAVVAVGVGLIVAAVWLLPVIGRIMSPAL